MVDINLGDILWYNVNLNEDITEPTKKDDVMKFIKDVIAPFPNSTGKGGVVTAKKVSDKPKTMESPAAPNNFVKAR